MDNVSLAPCPFCGSPGCFRRTSKFVQGVLAECSSADCEINLDAFGKDEQGAAGRWNRRPPSAAINCDSVSDVERISAPHGQFGVTLFFDTQEDAEQFRSSLPFVKATGIKCSRCGDTFDLPPDGCRDPNCPVLT